ncbi:MAG: ornithine--oxo-acid transaminase [Candidatus Yanofskybacteria bacterium]|nr:ornithine--oxo-acid transaminase [Candidatus Yanofskybacteria bacterium]
MSRTQDIIHQTEMYSANNYHPLPVVMTSGSGVWLMDVEGREYLDMFSAYSAQNFGHCHPRITVALIRQARRLGTTSRAVYTDIYNDFVQAIDVFCDMDKILPANGGAEAVETAIKLARKWGYEKKGVDHDRANIIFCDNNFHGRTISIISASSSSDNKNGFGPFTPGFTLVPFGDANAIERAVNENTVGVLLEPIQGEGGIILPPDGYLREVRNICNRHNVLFILDEIQTGFGRTGFNFAYEYEDHCGDVKPDILILGKALGGGVLPVSAVLSRKEIFEVIRPGDHGSTFGGNPLACAVGIAAINLTVDGRYASRSLNLGRYFMDGLRKIDSLLIKEVRGRGLMIGLELAEQDGIGRRFSEAMLREGVLCKETRNNVIRFSPPLIIGRDELDLALEKINKVILNWSWSQ